MFRSVARVQRFWAQATNLWILLGVLNQKHLCTTIEIPGYAAGSVSFWSQHKKLSKPLLKSCVSYYFCFRFSCFRVFHWPLPLPRSFARRKKYVLLCYVVLYCQTMLRCITLLRFDIEKFSLRVYVPRPPNRPGSFSCPFFTIQYYVWYGMAYCQ